MSVSNELKVGDQAALGRLSGALDKFAKGEITKVYADTVQKVAEGTLRTIVRGSPGNGSGLSAGQGAPIWSGNVVRNWRISASTGAESPPDYSQKDRVEAVYERITEYLHDLSFNREAAKALAADESDAEHFLSNLIEIPGSDRERPDADAVQSRAYYSLLFYERHGYYPEHTLRFFTESVFHGDRSVSVYPKTTQAERAYQQNKTMSLNKPVITALGQFALYQAHLGDAYTTSIMFHNPVRYEKSPKGFRESNRTVTTLGSAVRIAGQFADDQFNKADKQLVREASKLAKEAGFK